jgi:hypothetical protein
MSCNPPGSRPAIYANYLLRKLRTEASVVRCSELALSIQAVKVATYFLILLGPGIAQGIGSPEESAPQGPRRLKEAC